GIKNQTTASSERVSPHPFNGQRKVHYQVASYCVHIRLDSGFSDATKIFLRISVETIIPFRREPTVDVITVSHCESAGFRAALQVSLAAGVLREETSALQADL